MIIKFAIFFRNKMTIKILVDSIIKHIFNLTSKYTYYEINYTISTTLHRMELSHKPMKDTFTTFENEILWQEIKIIMWV